MFAQLSNPLHTFALLREELLDWWGNAVWKSSEEYKELVKARLSAHQLAMKEGYQSPYTHPEDFNSAWEPIIKRQRGD